MIEVNIAHSQFTLTSCSETLNHAIMLYTQKIKNPKGLLDTLQYSKKIANINTLYIQVIIILPQDVCICIVKYININVGREAFVERKYK